jgi:hypothetical protein
MFLSQRLWALSKMVLIKNPPNGRNDENKFGFATFMFFA